MEEQFSDDFSASFSWWSARDKRPYQSQRLQATLSGNVGNTKSEAPTSRPDSFAEEKYSFGQENESMSSEQYKILKINGDVDGNVNESGLLMEENRILKSYLPSYEVNMRLNTKSHVSKLKRLHCIGKFKG
ncbi:hypothetical protein D5086_000577 [Populus alba]|uniref:Uncharacterized protein n=1 Tax=Populus alba TaxID=43335 RepID=A0ACC4CW90_POPAL